MSLNVIDLIKGQLGPALVSQAASQLGESESGISKAIGGLLPAVVGGLANNADNPAVTNAITNAASSGLLSNLLGGSSNNSLISTVLSAIFGDKMSGLLNTVSSFAGVSNSSSSSLLNMVTGAALGSLGKYSTDNNLGTSGITKLLGDQKGLISTLLPAGLSLASLGMNWSDGKEKVAEKIQEIRQDVHSGAQSVREDVRQTATNVQREFSDDNGGGGSIWKWLLPLLLLLLAGWFLWKQCNKTPETTTTTTTDTTAMATDSAATSGTATTDSSAVATAAPAKVETEVVLPSGTKLKAYKGGIEDQIVTFLKSDEYKNSTVDQLKNKWFNFDNLNFEFGTTKLTAESQVQLNNLKAILKEFPDAKIKIGAYTDKKGDEKGNLALSQKRADAVKAALNSAQVTGAEGYGEQFATVAETASDKEREADRKTAIRFEK